MVRALTSHQCVLGLIPRPGIICGLSLLLLHLALIGFSPGTPVFPSPQKPTFPNSIFGLDYCQPLYHEPLARVMVRALPVFDIKFAFTFTNSEYTSVYFAVLVTSVSMESFIFNYLVRVGCVVSVVFSYRYFSE